MNWVTFEVEGGGLVKVRPSHVVAIYDEQGCVKLATIAGGVHLLSGMTVQRAAALVSEVADTDLGAGGGGIMLRGVPRQSV